MMLTATMRGSESISPARAQGQRQLADCECI